MDTPDDALAEIRELVTRLRTLLADAQGLAELTAREAEVTWRLRAERRVAADETMRAVYHSWKSQRLGRLSRPPAGGDLPPIS